jgi:hypothetical protein
MLIQWFQRCQNETFPLLLLKKKKFEDTKVVIRSRNSKDTMTQWPKEKGQKLSTKHYT